MRTGSSTLSRHYNIPVYIGICTLIDHIPWSFFLTQMPVSQSEPKLYTFLLRATNNKMRTLTDSRTRSFGRRHYPRLPYEKPHHSSQHPYYNITRTENVISGYTRTSFLRVPNPKPPSKTDLSHIPTSSMKNVTTSHRFGLCFCLGLLVVNDGVSCSSLSETTGIL
jgi:hypothetical protein